MSEASLRRGLWIRMAVACLLALTGVGLLLTIELVIAVLFAMVLVESTPELAAVVLVFALAGSVIILLWWVSVTVLKRLVTFDVFVGWSGRDETGEDTETFDSWFWNPIRTAPFRKIFLAAGGAVGAILAHRLVMDSFGDPLFVLGLLFGTGAVCWQCYRFVHRELGQDSAVRSNLEETYAVIDDPEREADVNARVHRLAQQADIPVPDVKIGASWTPQAATVGYRPNQSVVVVTRGLVDTLDDRQLDAVLAHELVHIGNRDAAVLTALSLPATKAIVLLERFSHPLILVVVGPVYVSSRVSVALVARYREYVADRAASTMIGDSGPLASALETLDREYASRPSSDLRDQRSTAAFGIVAPPWEDRQVFDGARRFVFRGVLGTHPPTEKRIERLRSGIESER